MVNIYNPHELLAKKSLWSDLTSFANSLANEKMCFIGDFNNIRDNSERIIFSYRRLDQMGFNNFIDNANLLELALINAQYTRFGPSDKKSRLDRALVNDKWWSMGSWSLRAINKKSSDHRGILVTS